MNEMMGVMKEAGNGAMQAASPMANASLAKGAMMATTGYVVTRSLGGVFRNPWVALAVGVVAGYMLHKYEKEIVAAVAKTTGMGKDFVLQQKETLADMVEEAKETEEQQAKP